MASGHHKPILAVITGHQTPYLIHGQRRLVQELSEVSTYTLVTKNRSTMWKSQHMPEINTVLLDETREDWEQASWPRFVGHELATSRNLVNWLNAHRPAAIITSGYLELPLLRALLWARRRGVPAMVMADSNVLNDTMSPTRQRMKSLVIGAIVRKYSAFFPCGSMGRKYFEKYGARSEQVFYKPLEPDYGQIESITAEEIDAACRKYGLRPGRRRLVNCNRLIELKRVDTAIDAFAQIAPDRPEWDLIIVGDGPERENLQKRVPAALRSRVQFLGQVSDMREIAAIYRASDALVLCSRYEAWSLVVNEAACAGLAIFVSHVVGAGPELVHAGVNGEVFAVGNAEELASKFRLVFAPEVIDGYKAQSRQVLASWRSAADPVDGVRRALRFVRAI